MLLFYLYFSSTRSASLVFLSFSSRFAPALSSHFRLSSVNPKSNSLGIHMEFVDANVKIELTTILTKTKFVVIKSLQISKKTKSKKRKPRYNRYRIPAKMIIPLFSNPYINAAVNTTIIKAELQTPHCTSYPIKMSLKTSRIVSKAIKTGRLLSPQR